MTAELPPLHESMTFLSPLSESRAHGLVSWLADGLLDGGTLLDAGCGWGELALRVAEASPAGHVVGVDLDEESIAEANRRAQARGVADRASFVVGDAATTGPDPADALVAIGATHVWAGGSEEPGPLPYAAAFDAVRRRVRPGARVVYGDGVWSRPPTPAATAPLGGRDDEFRTLADVADLADDAGFAVIAVEEASQEEWDEFESGFTARWTTWLARHPDGADAGTVRDRARRQRESYLRGYRGVLGLGYLRLVAVQP